MPTAASRRRAALPPEALPGEQELERAVEAVTLDDRLMDADVRDALFDDAAFEDCEELLDDFVIDASRPAADEPAEFDFDAHVARLIAAAEGAGDEDEDEDDASFDAAPPRAHAADDAAFDAALADWSSDDDDGRRGRRGRPRRGPHPARRRRGARRDAG